MPSRLMVGTEVEVRYETNGEEYRYHGTYRSTDDNFVTIKGTVGEDIGRMIMIPLSRVIAISWDRDELRVTDT